MKNSFYNIVVPMSQKWWIKLLLGFLFISIGILVFMTPYTNNISFPIFFSLVLATSGAFEIIAAFSYRETSRDWGWFVAEGIFDILIAAHLLWNPLVTISILPFIIGIWLLYKSVLAIDIPLGLKSGNHREWRWMLTLAITTMIFALLILFYSIIGSLGLFNASALASLTLGIFNISVAKNLNIIGKKIRTLQVN